ncbi:hypothetical protein AAG570_004541 [Ranatra chinensis]|uniref:Sensory neuron membrane protein 2 n=1 Tax=Ranatra chinensis TaxID=642074 RepID=A0ABD0YJC9_9HEMI
MQRKIPHKKPIVSPHVPGIVSLPHLMDASPDYQKMVDGLKPDPAKHSTFIELEPVNNRNAIKRLSENSNKHPDKTNAIHVSIEVHASIIVSTLLGFDLPDGVLQILRDQLLKVLNIVKIVKWVLIACGLVMAIVGGVMAAIRLLKDKK